MVLIAVFGVAPLIAVPLSGLAARTALPASFLFLVGGALVCAGFLGRAHTTAAPALFSVLFADGMHVSFLKPREREREHGKNPARALRSALGPGIPLASVARPCSRTTSPASAGRPSFLSDVHHSKENGHART